MRQRIYYRDEKDGKWKSKIYDTDKSKFLCDTPFGKLFQKNGRSKEFFFYNTEGASKGHIESITWSEASNIVNTYGTREQWIKEFTAMEKSTNSNDGGSTQIRLDSYHRIKAMRNADRLGLGITEYIKRLIDRDDNNRNY